MIVVQNHYFAADGQREAVIATRRDADRCRAGMGLAAGRTLVLAEGPEGAPDVVWELEFPDLGSWRQDLEALAASADFTAIRARQTAQLRDFKRCAFEVL